MPTQLVSDGREPLPSDSNGVEPHKQAYEITFGVSSMTACGDPFSYNAPPGPPWVRQLHQMIYKI
eukprot:2117621-Pleurochrysis_carterae.AAC.1